MVNKPLTAIWEITRECNMQCIHCGSAYTSGFSDKLTTNEAFTLCDHIGDLGISTITLSGGEPTTRSDWDLIALRLYVNGVIPNILSNGWFINESVARRAAMANINTIAISIDGLEETHDEIRRQGSYKRILNAFVAIKKTPVHLSVVTTINRRTIGQLPELLRILECNGVEEWLLRYGLPPDTRTLNQDPAADLSSVDAVLGFVHKYYKKTSVDLQLTGYSRHDSIIKTNAKQKGNNDALCQDNGYRASKTPVRILHNGEIPGGTLMREYAFIERSVIAIPIHEIRTDTASSPWNCPLDKSTSS